MFSNEKLTILYGSQTGNAQDVAERIWRDSKRFYFASAIWSLDNYNIVELVHERCVVFVCSTTGQGEEPDNMKSFWRFLLRKNLPTSSLQNLRFAVLGLGDSSYAKFNFVAKRLHKRLLQLGGESLVGLGLGDDQHDLGYDAVTDPWIESLWTNLLRIYPLPGNVQPLDRNSAILPRWTVSLSQPITTNNNSRTKTALQSSIYYSTQKPSEFAVTVLDNARITDPNHFQDVRLIKLNVPAGHAYAPGDVVVLRPKNLQWQIDKFMSVLETNNVTIDKDALIKLSETDLKVPVPAVLAAGTHYCPTLRQLCDEYFDLMAVPRRYTFSILAQLTDSELEREKCLEFTSAEGQDDLYTYCNRPRRNIVEVLQDFPNATKNIRAEHLFEILAPMKPREFSIASSCQYHRDEIHVLLAVVKYRTKLVQERFGLCSNYMARLERGDQVMAWLKRGSFTFPTDTNCPILMVGPGTGVAPFRNFIFERTFEDRTCADNLILFFGCRSSQSDFHCKDEWLKLVDASKLTLITAFSRELDHKVYVQHKIIENQDLVWSKLQQKAYIFVAGSAKFMPQEVRNAFVTVCETCGNMTHDEAEKFIGNMEKQNRYQTECWS